MNMIFKYPIGALALLLCGAWAQGQTAAQNQPPSQSSSASTATRALLGSQLAQPSGGGGNVLPAWLSAKPAASAGAATASSGTFVNEQIQVQLWAHAPQPLAQGQTLWLGVQLKHQKAWHTYWKNAGDSGLPTRLTWQLPAGLSAGAVLWPAPHAVRLGALTNFAYEGDVTLLVPVKLGAGLRLSDRTPEPLDIGLKVEWLVCRTECIPQEAQLSVSLPLSGTGVAQRDAFAQAQAAAPQRQPEVRLSQARLGRKPSQNISPAVTQAKTVASAPTHALALSWENLPPQWVGLALEVFPEQAGVFASEVLPPQTWHGAVWTVQLPLLPERVAEPGKLSFVLRPAAQNEQAFAPPHLLVQGVAHVAWAGKAWQLLDLPAPAPDVAQGAKARSHLPALGGPAVADAVGSNGASPGRASLTLALLSALLGGLLLNLMPCVFPILALKVVAFADLAAQAKAQTSVALTSRVEYRASGRAQLRWAGLAYTLGVVASFVLLGAVLLGLRGVGEAVGWGFQLQSPWVLCALAVLFCLLALNLWGLLEFDFLSRGLPSGLLGRQLRHPAWNAALSGVLAVWVAAPCSAPFMGASLGLAMTLPTAAALAVFVALGLGLALPFLLASCLPQALRWLPRPGAWMLRFRRAMAWPMWATLVWVLWVLGQVSGLDVLMSLLVLLLVLCAWVWAAVESKAAQVRPWVYRAVLIAPGVLVCWLAWFLALQVQRVDPSATAPSRSASVPVAMNAMAVTAEATTALDIANTWQAWSPQMVAWAQAQGKTVLVDFTAAWCLSCQYNKKLVLETPALLALAAQKQVLLLRADWTRRDARISAEISRLGRSGVPVYAVYRPGLAPLVLGEILSFSEVSAAIQ
jgi:thiol:disulfide interchange protein/DsbC/DsbD-like thiol-disulfide interchange protein